MKLSRSVTSIAALTLVGQSIAWVPPTSSVARPISRSFSRISNTLVFASVEDKVDVVAATPAKATTPAKEESTVAAIEEFPNLNVKYADAYAHVVSLLKGKIPEVYHGKMIPLLSHFAGEYLQSAQDNHVHNPESEFNAPTATAERFVRMVALALQYGNPKSPDFYSFDVSHTALRGGEVGFGKIDYYALGNNFFRHCMEFSKDKPIETHVLGFDNLKQALERVKAGENVIFLANHQSEADPQVVSLCLELCGEEYAKAAADMVYIAGHKVTTDVLAIPFSMGRNLICIHSKKHIDSDKETKPLKQRQNLKAMNALLRKLKDGGTMVWVAPSGGRDRRDLKTGTVPLAEFDSKTIDMFRLMGNKSGKPTHYYTMGMVTYDLCPPPDTIEAGTGEQRNVRFVPVGIKIGNELASVGGLESRHEFCDQAFSQCQADYAEIEQVLALYTASKEK